MHFFNYLSLAALSTIALASNWDTYPSVKQTASINGFADPIYNKLPDCAQDCVKFNTNNTPCPDWDTGCLCIMPQWSGEVAECVAQKCAASDVRKVTSLALSLCSSVGANRWEMPSSISVELAAAAAKVTADSSGSSSNSMTTLSPSVTPTASKAKATSDSSSSSMDTSVSSSSKATSASASSSEGTNAADGLLQVGGAGFLVSLLGSCLMFM
ncbi:hypothetical protein TRVA0_011S00210 [Trichomonascus vanleenenianus]|uniref:CFEM domain-containing protein n=1 Tax=Trichomonascus vanleenenianus TaxID=2268995 RepID=UPI003ECA241E